MRLEWVRGPGLGQTSPEPEGGGPCSRDGQKVGGLGAGIQVQGSGLKDAVLGRWGAHGLDCGGARTLGTDPPRTGGQASGSWGRVRSPWDRPWAGRQAGSELRGCSEPSWGCRASSGVQRGGPPYRVPALRKHHVSRGGRGLRPGSGGSGGAGRPRFVPDRQLRGPASRLLRRPPPARAARAIV